MGAEKGSARHLAKLENNCDEAHSYRMLPKLYVGLIGTAVFQFHAIFIAVPDRDISYVSLSTYEITTCFRESSPCPCESAHRPIGIVLLDLLWEYIGVDPVLRHDKEKITRRIALLRWHYERVAERNNHSIVLANIRRSLSMSLSSRCSMARLLHTG